VKRTTTQSDYDQISTVQDGSETAPPFNMYPASPAMSAGAVVIFDGPSMDMQICEFESKEAAAFYVATLNQVYTRGQVEGQVSAEQARAFGPDWGLWSKRFAKKSA
jgi:hypothetical protein